MTLKTVLKKIKITAFIQSTGTCRKCVWSGVCSYFRRCVYVTKSREKVNPDTSREHCWGSLVLEKLRGTGKCWLESRLELLAKQLASDVWILLCSGKQIFIYSLCINRIHQSTASFLFLTKKIWKTQMLVIAQVKKIQHCYVKLEINCEFLSC